MLRQSLVLVLSVFTFVSCNISQNSEEQDQHWDNKLSAEENIASHALAFQSDSVFPFLDELAKTRSVIILGEAGHGDATTMGVKRNMISYLSTKGIKAVAFEGYPFLSCYIFSNKEYSSFTKEWQPESGTKSTWAQEMFHEIRYFLDNNIKVIGIDVYAGFYDIDAAQIILNKYQKEDPFQMDWKKLKDYYYRKFIYPVYVNQISTISVSEQVELMQMINSISNYTHYLIHKKGKTTDFGALLQWIRNINANFSFIKLFEDNIDIYHNIPITTLPFRNRDSQIADNILWQTEYFPKEKFTVWIANYHGVKDISQTINPTDSLLYYIHQCAAEGVYNKLGDKVYSLAFTSLNCIGNDNFETGALESAIAKQTGDAPFAFIDFESLRFADGYRDKEFEAAMIKKKRGKWLYMFDGIYYIKNQQVLPGFDTH